MRLRYTKLGRIAFLGHLDLVRHLPRIFRRAGLELFYSVGFHPKPELTYGPALGLGIPSLAELLDVKMTEAVDPQEIRRRLQEKSLDGVEWTAAVALGDNDRALGRVLSSSTLWVRLPAGLSAGDALAVWRSDSPLRVKRTGEGSGVGRMIDVRRAVTAMRGAAGSPASIEARVAKLEWDDAGEKIPAPFDRDRLLELDLAITTEGSAKPIEVVEALLGAGPAAESSFARVAMWVEETGERHDPMDPAAFRHYPTAQAIVSVSSPLSPPPAAATLSS